MSGKLRWVCKTVSGGDYQYCYSTTNPERNAVVDRSGRRSRKAPLFSRPLRGKTRFLITAAQNATPVHGGFLTALETAAEHLSAELVVIPFRYKNPTSTFTASQANDETWDPKVAPYRYNKRIKLNKNLVLLGDVKTQPTATAPLTGFEALTHAESGILGHTKLQLKVIPTPSHRLPKIMTTTGAVTEPNYTDSKAGKLGEFHHTLGAALIEIDGGKFHLRQINAEKQTGQFIDLDKRYGKTVTKAGPAEAISFGDTHVDWIDPAVKRATYGKDGIVETLRSKRLIHHDLLDSYSVNPHHLGNAFIAFAKRDAGLHLARKEVERACHFVIDTTPRYAQAVIVPSNHDDMLRRWILSCDWRSLQDRENADFYLETALAMVRGTKMTDEGTSYPSPFVYWAKKLIPEKVARVLEPEEGYRVGDIECGMHGDVGPAGSRGTIKNLRRIGVKSIIAHRHSPGIDEGAMQNGTSTRLKAEYTRGPSDWLNSHTVIYSNFKRSLINIIDGEWRL